MILKYTFRLIKSTLNRFIAIVAIVFIGVSFMMGLRSNYDIMQNSVEVYTDDSKLYDFQIYSNFGFDQNDVDALKKQDYIEEVYASKTRDVYAQVNDDLGAVTRVLEIDSNLNTIQLVEGRMPTKDDECLMVFGYTSNLEIGTKFSLYLEDEEITDILKNTEYTVVGLAKTSEVMTQTFPTSNLNSKDLNNIIYIPNSNFISDYYTCLYLTIDGAREVFSFSDEYKELLDEKAAVIEKFSDNQSQELKNRILDEANQKLDEAKAELEENRIKYQREISNGKAELDNAKAQLDSALAQIQSGEAQIASGEQELIDGERELEEGKAELAAREAELAAGIAEFESSGMSMSQASSLVTNLYNQYTQMSNQNAQLTSRRSEVEAGLANAQAIIGASGCSSSSECRQKIQTIDPNPQPASDAPEDIAAAEEARIQAQAEINLLNEAISAFDYVKAHNNELSTIDRQIALNQVTINTLDAIMQSQLGMGVVDGYNYVTNAISLIRQGQAAIEQGKADLVAGEKRIKDGYAQLQASKQKLVSGKAEYESGLAEYNKGLAEYNDGLYKFEHEMQEAQDQIDDAEEQLASLSDAVWIVLKRYNTNYSYYMYDNTCEQMKSIGTIIPVLFFVVAALVCSTTMTRLIDEQRGQIGIYRALGFTKKEINGIYLLYVVIASLAASVVAVVVGVFLFPTIIYTTWRMLYDLPQIKISMPIDNLVLCISCFTILMMAVTYLVLNGTLKEVAAQLLRPKAPRSTKQIILEKWHWLWNKLPFTSKVTARNLLRYKARFIMTVIGVAGCTSLLLMGFGIKDSFSSVVELQYLHINKYNYQVNIKNDRHIDQILEDIRIDENNEAIVPGASYQSEILTDNSSGTITINVVSADSASSVYGLTNTKNKQVSLTDEGVLVTDKYAKNNGISIGDIVTLESQSGIAQDFVVSGIVKNYVGNVVYMSKVNYEKTFNEGLEYNVINVSNNGDSSKLISLQDKYNDVMSVTDFSIAIMSFTDMFDAMNLIVIVIIIVAGALAFVVLINLTNVNISERIREIATLKVLGFREYEVDSYIFKEVMLMSLIGAIIGLPIGVIEESYIMNVIDVEMCSFPVVIHSISFLYAFVITIIFTVIVLFLTRKTLRDVEMVESLKSVE